MAIMNINKVKQLTDEVSKELEDVIFCALSDKIGQTRDTELPEKMYPYIRNQLKGLVEHYIIFQQASNMLTVNETEDLWTAIHSGVEESYRLSYSIVNTVITDVGADFIKISIKYKDGEDDKEHTDNIILDRETFKEKK